MIFEHKNEVPSIQILNTDINNFGLGFSNARMLFRMINDDHDKNKLKFYRANFTSRNSFLES